MGFRNRRDRGGQEQEFRRRPANEPATSRSFQSGQIVVYNPPGSTHDTGSEGPGFGDLFSTRKPQHLGSGIFSGLKNVAKGVGYGAVGLVAAPAVKAHEEGIGGFFKGLGAGVGMAVVLPLAGVGYGVAQVARGAYHTPEAISEKNKGRKWDKKKREWKDNWYSLEEEAKEVEAEAVAVEAQKKELNLSAASTGPVSDSTRSGNVKDTAYYDLLGVPPTATQAEIRKAYYKLARDCHPDKNPDNPTAHQQFQQIGEAYQVLGDEKRRHDYDMHGKDAAQDMPMVDPQLFFAMLFGSEALEPFVGKLKMATFVEIFENTETPGEITEFIMEFEQRKREVDLAVKLVERLEKFVEGNEHDRNRWRTEMHSKAIELCKQSFGDAMVEAIGFIYENYAKQFLGKQDTFLGLGGRYAKFQAKKREAGNVWKIAGSAVRASVAAQKLSKAEERTEKAARQREAGAESRSEGKPGRPDGKAESKAKEEPTTGHGTGDIPKGRAQAYKATPDFPDSSSASRPATKPHVAEGRSSGSFSTKEAGADGVNPEEPFLRSTSEELRANEERAKQLAETMPLILQTMLNVCIMDVEATVRQAAKKALKDLASPIEVRRQRAQALIELGAIFQEEAERFAKLHKDEPVDVMRHMEEAFIRATAEADREAHGGEREQPRTDSL